MKKIIYLIICVMVFGFLSGSISHRRKYMLIDQEGLTYSAGDALLLEIGDYLLLESGDKLLLE